MPSKISLNNIQIFKNVNNQTKYLGKASNISIKSENTEIFPGNKKKI